ncbi:hypothetical protein FRB98_006758 [Tulasnella sp. 332]|nr:hypothetical protein FRB98_006758 [Tulasnella sp. 332]
MRCSTLLSLAGVFASTTYSVNAFVKGVNQPWGNGQYGHWFTTGYVETDVANTFAAAQDIGAAWVRVWMFEGSQGLTVDGNGYITGMTTQFQDNFWNMLWYANYYGIQVYPTFFNYPPGTSNFNVANFFTNSAAQTSLVNNLIVPLCAQWGAHSNIIAWELYNELNGFANPYFSGGNVVAMSAAQAWVKATTAALKQHSSKQVSVSQIMISDSYHPVGTSNKDYVGLGLDFYNIHVYNDAGTLPAASAFGLDKPVYLGEFGEVTASGDQHQNDVVYNFIKAAQSGGWAGALYWCLGFKGDYQQNPATSCPDSSLMYSLFNCEGAERQAYTTFKYL